MSSALDRRSREHWHRLTGAEKRRAVWNMTYLALGDYTIAEATGLSVEQV